MINQQESFPVLCKQFAMNIDGVKTEIVMNKYSNKIFIIVTQLSKIGSFVRNIQKKKNTLQIEL